MYVAWKQNNLEGFIDAHHIFFSWKVDFLSSRKRPNTSPYVEYSWTYDFLGF